MNTIDIDALEDVSPQLVHVPDVIDGKPVMRARFEGGFDGALWQEDDDIWYIDGLGQRWMTGWVGNRHVKRRVY
jgi:hypothetical protein